MVEINDSLRYTGDYVSVDYVDDLPHTIHTPSLEERVKALEEEVDSLRNQISLILNLDPIVLSIKEAITIEKTEIKKFMEEDVAV